MDTDPTPPDLFAYLDHRRFLEDWFAWKKADHGRYSHRAFARAAGVRSPSLLLQIIRGERNLTANTLPGFMKAIRLSREEREFFELLVELDRATDVASRNAVMRRIQGTRHFQAARPVEGEGFRYLSTWYLPAVRELALCPGFRADADWIARTLRPRITTAQAREALQTLQTLGLLTVDHDGEAQVHDVTVATPGEVTGLAVHNYHREMLTRAIASMEGVTQAERHLGALTVAIPATLVPTLKKRLHEMLQELLETCDGAVDEPDAVYQIGMQCFPLTQVVGGPEET